METDPELLRLFTASREEEAFRTLVRRHAPLVLGTARRIAGGDAHLAEDIAQGVFVQLAREAGRIPSRVPLTAWLHRRTVCAAKNAVRSERRRKSREQSAASLMTPHSTSAPARPVDEALNSLSAADRALLLLRYHEERSLREISAALGLSEDMAQKRVSRALERLRVRFAANGAALTVAALTAVLTETLSRNSGAAAPAVCERLATGALNKTPSAAIGFNLLSPLAGAALIFAVGVLIWREQERELTVLRDRERTAPSLAFLVDRAASAGLDSSIPAWARRSLSELLQVMKQESSHMPDALSDARLAAAVEEMTDADLPAALEEILTWSAYQKDRALGGMLHHGLMTEWRSRDPAAAVAGAARHAADPAVAIQMYGIYYAWLAKNPSGAIAWLAEFANAGNINGGMLLGMAGMAPHVSDPQLCLEAASRMPAGSATRAMEMNALNALQRKSPEKALGWIEARPRITDRLRHLLNLSQDPTGVVTQSIAALPAEERAAAVTGVAFTWFRRTAGQSEPERWLETLTPGTERDAALRAAAVGKVSSEFQSPDQAAASFTKAWDLASLITDESTRVAAREGVMLRWAAADKSAAAAFLEQCPATSAEKESLRTLIP